MSKTIKEKSHSLVVRGLLNPSIFQPYWFNKNGLLNDNQAEKAVVKVIHPSISDFNIEWANIHVQREILSATTSADGSEGPLKDFIAGTFKLLSHTPVFGLGINREFHFVVQTKDELNEIGHKLVPKKTLWSAIMSEPGTASVSVQGKHRENSSGILTVRIEPSKKYPSFGVYVNINDHYEIENKTALEMVEVLEKEWRNSMNNSNKIVEQILSDL